VDAPQVVAKVRRRARHEPPTVPLFVRVPVETMEAVESIPLPKQTVIREAVKVYAAAYRKMLRASKGTP
jgi:hypothetical protein